MDNIIKFEKNPSHKLSNVVEFTPLKSVVEVFGHEEYDLPEFEYWQPDKVTSIAPVEKYPNFKVTTGVEQQPVNEAARKEILAAWQEDS